MEAFIKFFFAHINIIIYVLGLITVLLIGVMTFLNLGADSENSNGSGGVDNKKITDLENLLKKMLESAQTRVVPATGVVDTEDKSKDPSAPAPQQVVVKEVDTAALNEAKAEVQTLKGAVNEKEAIIAKLKSSLELAQQEQTKKAAPGQQMQEKLRELEAKLAEYEIIEDDIADLTMYKEENAQLKEQIKQLMKGQSAAVTDGAPAPVVAEAPAPAPAAAPAPVAEAPVAAVAEVSATPVIEEEVAAPAAPATPVVEAAAPATSDPVSDDLLEQFKQALTEQAAATEPKVEPVVSTEQSPSPQVEAAVNDDLMSEFENALSAQRKSDAAPAQIQGPIPSFPIGGEAGAETHDIMAEFVTDALVEDGTNVHMPLDTSTTITAANDPLATTDPNKMISEVESLTAQSTDADGNALEGETDTDKMLKEMEDFKKLASGE